MDSEESVDDRLIARTWCKGIVLALTIMGVAAILSDGILTPAGQLSWCLFNGPQLICRIVSVLSAVGGLTVVTPLDEPSIQGISIAILVVLFAVQRYGTSKIGFVRSSLRQRNLV